MQDLQIKFNNQINKELHLKNINKLLYYKNNCQKIINYIAPKKLCDFKYNNLKH